LYGKSVFEVHVMAETTTPTTPTTLLNVTEAAAEEVKKLLATEPDKSGLRLEVRGGGCSGMSYGLSFDNAQEKDHTIELHGVKVFVDPKSAVYLKGTELDFHGGLDGKGFAIKNPNARGSCGCGNSFSV
jgi:iron-sulfur cluster assembly protein